MGEINGGNGRLRAEAKVSKGWIARSLITGHRRVSSKSPRDSGADSRGLIDDLSKSFHVVTREDDDDDNAARYLMFLPQRKSTLHISPPNKNLPSIELFLYIYIFSLSPLFISNNLSSKKKSPLPRHIISFEISQNIQIPIQPDEIP